MWTRRRPTYDREKKRTDDRREKRNGGKGEKLKRKKGKKKKKFCSGPGRCSLFLVANFELARQAVPNGAKVLRTVHSRHAGGDRRVILTQGQIRGRQAGSREADRPPAEYAKYLCLFVSLGLMIDRSREGTARYRLRACCADGHVLRATMTHIRIESNRIEQSSGSGVVLVLTSVVRGPASVGWDEAENIHPFSVPAIMTIMIAETNRSS